MTINCTFSLLIWFCKDSTFKSKRGLRKGCSIMILGVLALLLVVSAVNSSMKDKKAIEFLITRSAKHITSRQLVGQMSYSQVRNYCECFGVLNSVSSTKVDCYILIDKLSYHVIIESFDGKSRISSRIR